MRVLENSEELLAYFKDLHNDLAYKILEMAEKTEEVAEKYNMIGRIIKRMQKEIDRKRI